MTQELMDWYRRAGRCLPWRETSDPYAIWVSEVMLQQTQVATVLPYYQRWLERFPTVASLAAASEQEALAEWQGLGYYRRCRMLLEGAKLVAESGWPSSFAEWRKMPGVGDYTAAAMASICLGESEPVVDGNVERVFARVEASALTGPARTRAAREWARGHIPTEDPATFNQAIMELGATVCKPQNPGCDGCPISSCCRAYGRKSQAQFPVANPKAEPVTVGLEALVWTDCQHVALVRASSTEWWSGMLRFPYKNEVSVVAQEVGKVRHTVTRHKLSIGVWLSTSARRESDLYAVEWHRISEIESLPVPTAMRKVWKAACSALQS